MIVLAQRDCWSTHVDGPAHVYEVMSGQTRSRSVERRHVEKEQTMVAAAFKLKAPAMDRSRRRILYDA